MKKIIVILIVMLLAGCASENKQTNIDELSIAVPSGAPSLAFNSEIDNDNFVTGDAQSILPQLKGDNGSDIIVIDTVNGVKALNAGANYYLAATLTFGNFFIASTGNDENKKMEDGDYIVLFSQGATPDLIFHYIYGDSLDSNIHYVNAVTDAATCLIKGINITDPERSIDEDPYVDYVLMAEPVLTAAMSQNDRVSSYVDIQKQYKSCSDGLSMIQASVFVRKDLGKETIDAFLNKLENNVNTLIDNPNHFAAATQSLSDVEVKDIFGIPNAGMATKVLKYNVIGMGFKKAYDIKDDIDKMLSIFGVEKTNEEIYYK